MEDKKINHNPDGQLEDANKVHDQSIQDELGNLSANLPITELINRGKSMSKHEFQVLNRETLNQKSESLLYKIEEVKHLNRYSGVLPYQHSMVKLGPDTECKVANYINANYLRHPHFPEKVEVIATQAPLPHTLSHFWQMVWQENIPVIVMLCVLQDKPKPPCHAYWPINSDDSFTVGKFLVQVKYEEIKNEFYLVRHLLVTDTESTATREVKQYHCVGWPDMGVPTKNNHQHVLTLLQELSSHRKEVDHPFVIHCSAGIGRTGTLTSLLFLKYLVDHQQKLGQPVQASVFSIVKSLREQRFGSVETDEQYEFIYKILALLVEEKDQLAG